MSFDRKGIAAIVFAVIFCGTFVSRSVAQQTSAARRQLPAIIDYNGDMTYLVAQMPNVYGVTIGLEVDPQQPYSRAEFYLRDPTLADVLNAIAKSAPRYHWRESDEFIEILPLAGSSPLLDTVISNFRVDDVDGRGAITQLVKLPEVQASMGAMRLNRRDPRDASTEENGKKFSLSLESVTLRQALNRIAKESGTRFWILRRDSNGFISISNSPR